MEGALERRAFELRSSEDGRVVEGVAVPYRSKGIVGAFTESFTPGSLRFAPGGVFLNVQHDRGRLLGKHPDGGLTLTDGAEALSLRAELPDTAEGRDVQTLIQRGVFGGFSIEFRAVRDAWQGTHRTITEAVLAAVSIVDRPVYAGATISAGAEMRSEDYLAVLAGGKRRRLWLSV